MLFSRATRLASYAFALAISLSAASAQPLDWIALKPRSEVINLRGQSVTIIIRPEARIQATNVGWKLELRAFAGLGDLQAKAPAMLAALAAGKTSCTDRWSFPSLQPIAVSGGKLMISGEIRFEKWACEKILGQEVKTRLFQETAGFGIAVFPAFDATEVRLQADLERFDLGQSLLDDLDLDDELVALLERELASALSGDSARLGFPEEVRALNPTFTQAEIRDGGSEAVLFAAAEAPLSLAAVAEVMALLLANR